MATLTQYPNNLVTGNVPPKRYFVGFSTRNSARTGVRTLYDIQLINVDLMTSFMTRVGERVMRPDWGCKLWDYLMEPFTTMMQNNIITESLRICSLDSRVLVVNDTVQIFQLDSGFRIEINLQYLPWNVIGTFYASFIQDELTYYGPANTNLLS